MYRLKLVFYFLCRSLGLFRLAKYLTRKQYRVLCYHGFSFDDEHVFHPKLFMHPNTLSKRLDVIKKAGYNVQPLGKILEGVENSNLPDYSLAVTVDDGWKSVHSLAAPIFKQYQMPWMLYLTTYYVTHPIQVVNVAIRYILWKTKKSELNLAELVPSCDRKLQLTDSLAREEAASFLFRHCDELELIEDRQTFVNKLAADLGVEWQTSLNKDMFLLITPDECKALFDNGVDIELHTHRHGLPESSMEDMLLEITENRKIIESICGNQPKHFCYPSGYYTDKQLEWLGQASIASATTCHAGLNNHQTPVFELLRFLDGENIHPLEFEAEISGFRSLIKLF